MTVVALRALCLGASLLSAVAMADAPSPPSSGVHFDAAQAAAGRTVFEQNCAACHGADLSGGDGPPLAGAAFQRHWANGRHKVDDLHFMVSEMMPLQAPHSLTDEQYTDLVAFILSRNGLAASDKPLDAAGLQAVFTIPGSAAAAGPPLAPVLAPPAHPLKATTDRPTDDDLLAAGD
ncbi:MAG TPA: c-type cytochrome, partial [Stellaceae bacterium]|nr:c-type cytochrome [Stellaceae bacterium]